MRQLRMFLFATVLAGGSLAGCTSEQTDSVTGYVNAVTGETCQPDPATLHRHGQSGQHGNGGHGSPTGIPGDNMDDEHSGKVDCLGDGNSGQGDDKKHPCCDDSMCCDGTPTDDPDDPSDDPTDPSDDPTDDGPGTGDPGTGDPGTGDPTPTPPEPLPPVD